MWFLVSTGNECKHKKLEVFLHETRNSQKERKGLFNNNHSFILLTFLRTYTVSDPGLELGSEENTKSTALM